MAMSSSGNKDTTPRPSISPLSTRASPAAVRRTPVTADDQDDDDRSSSLSEPEDDIEDDATPNIAEFDPKHDVPSSEERAAHQSVEVDSEAETERIDQTPAKARKEADATQKTPSKLNQAATADDDLSDPPSPIPAGPGAASSTSTIETASKKRKRSDTADSSLTSANSELGESPRKRSHSAAADDATDDKANGEDVNGDVPEPVEAPIETEDHEVEDEGATITVPPKSGRGRKAGRPKGKMKKELAKDDETEKQETDPRPDEEQNEEGSANSAEDMQRKQAASTVFEDLAKQFAAFRERVNNERLAAVDAELDMLNQPDCQHQDYVRQVACVDARRQKQIKEAEAFYKFKLQSIRRTTLAERSQLHSQYFQHARELREDVMYKLGEDWYNIQKERRQSHQEKDDAYIFKFPTKKSDQIKQQAKYNQEVSVLSGVAKYVGFPAAPDIAGAEGDSLEDDLKAMKISRRTNQLPIAQSQSFLVGNRGRMEGQRERLAHEQYLEQNAWARPQAPLIHNTNHVTPNLTHTPDWADSKHAIRNLSGVLPRTGSPYTTPMAQRRPPLDHSSSEIASSVLAAPPTSDRREQGSPLAVSKHRQYGGELTGFRNISGASTIDAPESAEKRDRGLLST
ncbi:hypothetical protein AC578_10660 [Lecanosticta acicola]|uniref:Transcriptional regulatory protein DEP1 n=1 Tax=Lecanosticta acicola TaxID=111012 RepID=A0AAI9ED16_9PEZI|nr:hypothetical protein AC578_10660 [Lecanosticta acicola]